MKGSNCNIIHEYLQSFKSKRVKSTTFLKYSCTRGKTVEKNKEVSIVEVRRVVTAKGTDQGCIRGWCFEASESAGSVLLPDQYLLCVVYCN